MEFYWCLFNLLDVRKHPCFDVKVHESYLVKWKRLYDQYRAEMYNALRPGKEKNDEANEVIKKYKEVSILFLICFINPFLLKQCGCCYATSCFQLRWLVIISYRSCMKLRNLIWANEERRKSLRRPGLCIRLLTVLPRGKELFDIAVLRGESLV